ncbi:hypothetical protein [Microbispora hainanensis]|uniref:hypothetical protein n=1 Tax=Microbispora hainanensis TaxID=568844 RepID=UPI0033C8703B
MFFYELTEWGHDMAPILVHLGRWGRQSPLKETTTPLGEPDRWDAALRTDPAGLKALVIDGTPPVRLGERLKTTGDRAVLQRLLDAIATE